MLFKKGRFITFKSPVLEMPPDVELLVEFLTTVELLVVLPPDVELVVELLAEVEMVWLKIPKGMISRSISATFIY